jgi:hypothetical protein
VKTELIWVPCVTSFSFHVRWFFISTAFVLSSAVFMSHYVGILLDTMTCKSPSAFVARVLTGDPAMRCSILWGRKTPGNSLRDNAPCSAVLLYIVVK